jgi:hypothetical protein
MKFIEVDLLRFLTFIETKIHEGQTVIKDPIRKKWILLQPEEMVRQLLIQYLIRECNISSGQIQVEKSFKLNGLQRRFDIVVYDSDVKPYILVECKAPDQKINQIVFDQVSAYNLSLGAPYVLVTNGKMLCVAEVVTTNGYYFLDSIP